MQSLPFLEADDELPLMQSSHQIHSNPSLDKGLQLINTMIELDYIKYDDGLKFTSAGIEYMMKKWNEFNNSLAGKDINFGDFTGLVQQTSKATSGITETDKFMKDNLLLGDMDEGPDYNDPRYARYVKEARYDKIQPPVDSI